MALNMTGVFTAAHRYLIWKCEDQAGELSNDVGAMKNYGYRSKVASAFIFLISVLVILLGR